MHDINGKPLHIGSDIYSSLHGLCKIVGVREEHNPDQGGACIEVNSYTRGGGIILRTHEHKVTKVRTWKEMAEESLRVQDACNLSGVVHAFSTIITEVRTRLDSEGQGGTDNVNNHPVCRLFSDKIASLTGTQFCNDDAHQNFSDAYKWAHEQSK